MIILSISHIGPYNVALKKATRKSLFFLHTDQKLGSLYFTGYLQFFHRALAPIVIVRFVRLLEIYFNFFRENYFLYLLLIKYKKCTKYVQFSRLPPLVGILVELNYNFSPLLYISHQCSQFICIYLNMSTLASFVFTLVSLYINVSKFFNVCFYKRLSIGAYNLIYYKFIYPMKLGASIVQCKGIVKT